MSKDITAYPGNENYKPENWCYLLSPNPDKRRAEIFFWKYNLCWLLFFGGIVVTKAYENFDKWSYLFVGLTIAIPPILIPLLFPSLSGEQNIKWTERYTTKANIWIVMFAFVGNYFWTHYFYKVLLCGYTVPSHRLNDVPICMYLITVGYFHLYHDGISILLRKTWRAVEKQNIQVQYIIVTAIILIICYITAIMEAVTIASFPYYTYPDTKAMLIFGSGFYAIYFLGSFPAYLRIDEYVGKAQYALLEKKNDNSNPAYDLHSTSLTNVDGYRFTLFDTLKDVLAHNMYTTILLDFWRISIGQITGEASEEAVSWIY